MEICTRLTFALLRIPEAKAMAASVVITIAEGAVGGTASRRRAQGGVVTMTVASKGLQKWSTSEPGVILDCDIAKGLSEMSAILLSSLTTLPFEVRGTCEAVFSLSSDLFDCSRISQ